MIKERRNWKMIDPVEYFRQNYSHIKGMTQLRREDSGLYLKLRKTGKIAEVFPGKQHRDFNQVDPVDLFHQKYFHVTSRAQLDREDQGLYDKLRALGKLDELLPNQNHNDRDWSTINPVDYFRQNYSNIINRTLLMKEDRGLYWILMKTHKIDEVLPQKQIRKEPRNYSKTNPVTLFHEKYPHVTSRGQLQKEDKRLYVKLWEIGKLDEVLPQKKICRDFNTIDPVQLFHERYSHVINRAQLYREDPGLCVKLRKMGKLDDLLPSLRDWSKIDPVEYFRQNCTHITSRDRLEREDPGLYQKLRALGKLDLVISSQDSQKAKALEKVIERYII